MFRAPHIVCVIVDICHEDILEDILGRFRCYSICKVSRQQRKMS